jgi:hypothetical protein
VRDRKAWRRLQFANQLSDIARSRSAGAEVITLLERVRLDILLDEMHKAGFQRESKIWLSTRYTHVMAITEMRVRGITTNAV